MKLKKGDTILITAGKDRGKQGQIEKVMLGDNAVVVPGMNLYKRHRKARVTGGQQGDIQTIARPLPVSGVALVCPKCKQPTRVGYRVESDKKVRICRKCEATI